MRVRRDALQCASSVVLGVSYEIIAHPRIC